MWRKEETHETGHEEEGRRGRDKQAHGNFTVCGRRKEMKRKKQEKEETEPRKLKEQQKKRKMYLMNKRMETLLCLEEGKKLK